MNVRSRSARRFSSSVASAILGWLLVFPAALFAGRGSGWKGWPGAFAEEDFSIAAVNAAPGRERAFGLARDFTLLPRSFQRRPQLDINVLTEFTERGWRMTRPNPATPARYVAQSGGYRALGEELPVESSPTAGALRRVLRAMLATEGLVPVEAGEAASYALVFHWGSHYRATVPAPLSVTPSIWYRTMGGESDESRSGAYGGWALDPINPPERLEALSLRDLQERAVLLAGERFAREYSRTIAGAFDDMNGRREARRRLQEMARYSPEAAFLVSSLDASLYFVVISAYDAGAIATGRRELLWRTKIALVGDGLSLVESTPAMLAAAAPYLGKPTGNGVLIERQLDRKSGVVLGEPEVIEWLTEDDGHGKPAAAPATGRAGGVR